MWERHRRYTPEIDFGVLPSEMYRDHIYGCFIEDSAGIDDRYRIGVSQITWESDYPHSDGNWPHSRKVLAEALADVPDEEARQMVELNARKLLNFDADLRADSHR
jgi:hypothetical protein